MTNITQEEFKKVIKYNFISSLLLLGLILLVPILYSIAANTQNYVLFYGMCIAGLFCIVYSFIKYFKWRKKYEVKRNG